MNSIVKEFDSPNTESILESLDDPQSTAPWYIVIRSIENFREKFNRYPGVNESDIEGDFKTLKEEVTKEIDKLFKDS